MSDEPKEESTSTTTTSKPGLGGVVFMKKSRPAKLRRKTEIEGEEEEDGNNNNNNNQQGGWVNVGGGGGGGGGLLGAGIARGPQRIGPTVTRDNVQATSESARAKFLKNMSGIIGKRKDNADGSNNSNNNNNSNSRGKEEDDEGDYFFDASGAAGAGAYGVAAEDEELKHKTRFAFASTRSAMPAAGPDGMKISAGHDLDALEILQEKRGENKKNVIPGPESGTEGADGKQIYRGMGNYKEYREKREVLDKKMSSVGPQRAPAHIRVTSMFDYKPDICKDYKETGYCSFGDSCKFMHDRGDYKAGWEIEKEWEEEQKEKRKQLAAKAARGGGDDDDENGEEEDEDLPFACHICRLPFLHPVVTRCQHYFCESCALKRYATESKRCAICDEQTHGIFNTATVLVKRMLQKGKNPYKREEGVQPVGEE